MGPVRGVEERSSRIYNVLVSAVTPTHVAVVVSELSVGRSTGADDDEDYNDDGGTIK